MATKGGQFLKRNDMTQKYDVIVIGAGMSGLAASIRLAMFGKKVVCLEKHSISGGLNSYYRRGKRNFDVGLHALTNFAQRGERGKPLTKLLKQLRIPWKELELIEQKQSKIIFPDTTLTFNNDFATLVQDIAEKFPTHIDEFNLFVEHIKDFNEVALTNETFMAKDVARKYIKNEKLISMIFAPLLIYGSAWEDDMDFSQFVIMFKSIYLEGFARPDGGVRKIINLLLDKYKDLGGELRFRAGVQSINTQNDKVTSVTLENGEVLECEKVISSMGHPETMSITQGQTSQKIEVGPMTFCETILCLDERPKDFDMNDTILFYNEREDYQYRAPSDFIDDKSAVICFPNNFADDDNNEGLIRLTYMANYEKWKELVNTDRKAYLAKKNEIYEQSLKTLKTIYPNAKLDVKFKDVFTPHTIERYTGHMRGCVYGSTQKLRDGRTPVNGLFLCGTDQGFLGIIGSMLSGISMANLHGLME